jgi:multiple sugar transport system substrate-binding protein
MFFPSPGGDEVQGPDLRRPVYSGSYALLYNKALFRQAGLDPERPPQTWEEVFALARRFVKRNERGQILTMGFIPNYGNVQVFMLMAWQLGAQFLSPDGARVHVADSAVVGALDWVRRFYSEYRQQEVAAFLGGLGFADQHGFIAEKIAMMILDSSFPDQIRAYKPSLDYGVAMIPTFAGRPTASVSGSWWLGIPRGAKYPEEAWEFIKHAVTKESQLLEIEKTEESLFPANRFAAEDPRFMNTAAREIFVRMMNYSHSPSVVPLAHDVFWREIGGAQERVIHGLQNPTQALRQAEHQIQSVLDDARDYDQYVHAHAGSGR